MNTQYLVQVGKDKGSYRTRWSFDSLSRAVPWYRGLNIHSGYKKRLVGPDGKIIDRYIS